MNGSTESSKNPPAKPFQSEGLRRVFRAGLNSLEGLGAAFKHEAAFRQECIITLVLLPVALILDFSAVERILLIGVLVLVLITELLNSAVECCIDYISTDLHPYAKRAKDIGSAAVLLSLAFAVGTWISIFWVNWPVWGFFS